ncbi:unnamed protein product [Polarella glacialis]|uniref:Laccase n=1 Tax=Polarella glacialis TaxID=89957 RepID=A0A813JKL6_POLGL|nr:unnamed protein product [Polarella glacialis]
MAILANNSFPGPTVEAFEGDTIEVTVVNNLIDLQVAIQWEGVSVQKSPTGQINVQGGQFKYVLLAAKAGTFWWHASTPTQAASGLKGALVVRSHGDPHASKYTEERMMVLSDARQRPEVCFGDQGALVAACPEIEKATFNGQWGDGSKNFPLPVLEVTKGECYRLRFLGLMSAAKPYFNVSIEGHSVQVLGQSSATTTAASEFSVRAGEGVDVILCADQSQNALQHDYSMTMKYVGQTGAKSFSGIVRYPQNVAVVAAAEQIGSPVLGKDKFDMSTCEVEYVFDMRDSIVDYKRPTIDLGGKASRQSADNIPLSNRKAALLVNDSYPGPLVEAIEGQLICVTVNNNFVSDPVSLHWHGQHMKGFPAFDGIYGVTQGAINPGESMVYRWRANAGTAWWHGHMQALQADKGLKGPIVIHAKNDPHKHLYSEERIVTLSDEWVDPGMCLRAEGAQPGNPVCAEIEKATWNGQWGDGSDEYPWPKVTVEQGKCYRIRFIGMMGQAQNFQIQIAGHNMTLIAVDGADVVPVQVSSFNLHAGERADIVVCADQAPAPKLPRVDSSKFWAFLNYAGHTEKPRGYHEPSATGGGLSAKAVAGFRALFGTRIFNQIGKVKNIVPVIEPEKADVTYVFDVVGIAAPSFKPGVTPYSKSDQLYMFTEKKPWRKPSTPLLHTKGECGAERTPFITVPEGATTVEVIINNLSPTAHVLHMHGMRFTVVNYAPFSESWCSNAQFECFFEPIGFAKRIFCPGARLGDNSTEGPGNEYWGCPYDADKDTHSQNLDNPLQKDMISLWRRSWAVIRFKVDNPGVWLFHCHMEQHIPTGQIMAFSLLPAQQPPIPDDVPTEGPCPIWHGRTAGKEPRIVAADFGHPHTCGRAYYVATRFFDREARTLQPGFVLAFAEAECLRRAGFELWDLGGADRSPMMQYKPQVAIEMHRSEFMRRLREVAAAAAAEEDAAGPGRRSEQRRLPLTEPSAPLRAGGERVPTGIVFEASSATNCQDKAQSMLRRQGTQRRLEDEDVKHVNRASAEEALPAGEKAGTPESEAAVRALSWSQRLAHQKMATAALERGAARNLDLGLRLLLATLRRPSANSSAPMLRNRRYVTTDRAHFKPPESQRHPAWSDPGKVHDGLHWDIETSEVGWPVPFAVQGVLYLEDTAADQGALRVVPGFHRRLAEWSKSQPSDRSGRECPQSLQAGAVPVPGPAGSLVLWHSLLPHGPTRNVSRAPRVSAYVSMLPADAAPYLGPGRPSDTPLSMSDAGTVDYDDLEKASKLKRLSRESRTERWRKRLPLLREDPPEHELPRRPPGEEDGQPCLLSALGQRLVGLVDWEKD